MKESNQASQPDTQEIIGNIHSMETFGTVDGPGIRTVVFLQGCNLRCKFCHNIDCAVKANAQSFTVTQLIEQLLKNQPYWKTYAASGDEIILKDIGGGVTFSGGEPLLQWEFLLQVVMHLKKAKVHVAIDTNFHHDFSIIQKFLPYVDLWMISIKQMDDAEHIALTEASNKPTLENIKKLDQELANHKEYPGKIRIKFVVIPSLTDDNEHLQALGTFVSSLKMIEGMQLLAYVTFGRYKWMELFNHYSLDGIPEAGPKDMERAKTVLSSYPIHLL